MEPFATAGSLTFPADSAVVAPLRDAHGARRRGSSGPGREAACRNGTVGPLQHSGSAPAYQTVPGFPAWTSIPSPPASLGIALFY